MELPPVTMTARFPRSVFNILSEFSPKYISLGRVNLGIAFYLRFDAIIDGKTEKYNLLSAGEKHFKL